MPFWAATAFSGLSGTGRNERALAGRILDAVGEEAPVVGDRNF